MFARAEAMYQMGHDFFSGAGFSEDQDFRLRSGGAVDLPAQDLNSRAVPDQGVQ
jgi:hypothetical protein